MELELKDCDGGVRAWVIVLGAWCAMVPSMGLLNTMAVLEAWLAEHQLEHVPKSTVGWVFSCYAFFLYFCGAQVGPIFDAHDIRVLIVPGSVGIIAALILFSFSDGMRILPSYPLDAPAHAVQNSTKSCFPLASSAASLRPSSSIRASPPSASGSTNAEPLRPASHAQQGDSEASHSLSSSSS